MNATKLAIFAIFILCAGLVGYNVAENVAEASSIVTLKIRSTKTKYQLGEIISIETKITNNTSRPIDVHGDSRNWTAVKIAFNQDNNYKFYVGAGRAFTVDGINLPDTIKPRGALRRKRTILWNHKPSVSHLNSNAAAPLIEGRILTDYALPVAGTYFIKYCSAIEQNGKFTEYESKPIEIIITEPVGQEMEVWSKIKDNGEFPYLMQEGEMTRGYKKPEEIARFQREVESILYKYPNSLYAEPLMRGLIKIRSTEARRQEFNKSMLMPQ